MFWCIKFVKMIILDDIYLRYILYIINYEDVHESINQFLNCQAP